MQLPRSGCEASQAKVSCRAPPAASKSEDSEEFTMHRNLVHARIPICMPTQQQPGAAAMACPAPEATCVLIGIQDALHAAYSCSGALMSALRRRIWAACPGPRHRLVRRHRRSASSEEFITHGHLVPAWNPICQKMQLQQRPAAMACPEPEEVCALKRISGRQARLCSAGGGLRPAEQLLTHETLVHA